MNEISIEKFISKLDDFKVNGINYNVKFLSPKKQLLSLNRDSIDTDNPESYVLVDFVEAECGNSITLNELINRFSDLGEDYYHTFIDFLQPDNKSMIFSEDSVYIRDDGYLIIQFERYIPH